MTPLLLGRSAAMGSRQQYGGEGPLGRLSSQQGLGGWTYTGRTTCGRWAGIGYRRVATQIRMCSAYVTVRLRRTAAPAPPTNSNIHHRHPAIYLYFLSLGRKYYPAKSQPRRRKT